MYRCPLKRCTHCGGDHMPKKCPMHAKTQAQADSIAVESCDVPKLESIANFDTSPTPWRAVLALWESCGAWRYRDADKLDFSDEYEVTKMKEAIEKEAISIDAQAKMVQEFQARTDAKQKCESCAVCGVKNFPGTIKYTHLDINTDMDCIKLTSDEHSFHDKRGDDVQGLYNVCSTNNEDYYYLHRKFTYTANDGKWMAVVCTKCAHDVKQGRRPQYSIASGLDYGNLERVRLPTLSLFERKLLMRHRKWNTVIKLVAPGNLQDEQRERARQSAVKGHHLVFPHEGPDCACDYLTSPTSSPFESFGIVFVGPRQDWDKSRLTLKEKFPDILQVRAPVLRQWIQVLRQLNPEQYGHLPDLSDEQSATTHGLNAHIDQLQSDLFNNTHVMEDTAAHRVERHTMSDVAAASDRSIESVMVMPAAHMHTIADLPKAMLHNLYGNLTDDPIKVHRDSIPLCDFTENNKLLLGCFPDTFLTCSQLKYMGTLPPGFVQHLLYQHDGRFAKDQEFLFLLFNQQQRHANVRAISTRVKGHPAKMQRFLDLVRSKDFRDEMKRAINETFGKEARKVLGKLLPLLGTAGAKVPGSSSKQHSDLSMVYAYSRFFDLHSMFITVSFDDTGNRLLLRFAMSGSDPGLMENVDGELGTLSVPAWPECARLLAENPVFAAIVFRRITCAIAEVLIGLSLDPSKKTSSLAVGSREPGMCGVPLALIDAIEAQGRGTLHGHLLFWGGLSAALLQNVAHHELLRHTVGKVLDTMMSAHVDSQYAPAKASAKEGKSTPAMSVRMDVDNDQPSETHNFNGDHSEGDNQTVHGVRGQSSAVPENIDLDDNRYSANENVNENYNEDDSPTINALKDQSIPCPKKEPLSFRRFTHALAWLVQRHILHQSTCRKGKAGQYGCRLAMPQKVHPLPSGPVQLHLRHQDGAPPLGATGDTATVGKHKIVESSHIIDAPPTVPVEAQHQYPFGVKDRRWIFWELHRPTDEDKDVVSWSPLLTAVTRSNTAVYLLGSLIQAVSIVFYIASYLCKDALQPANSLSCILEAQKVEQKYGSTAADAGTDRRSAQFILERTLNNMVGKIGLSAQFVALTLLGTPTPLISHDTTFVFVHPAINRVKSAKGGSDCTSNADLYGGSAKCNGDPRYV